MSAELKEQVTRAENERCRCIVAQDFPALRNLLSSRLIHVHTRGKTDEVSVEAQVMQVWAREDDGAWRQLAFQATPLGQPPAAVQR